MNGQGIVKRLRQRLLLIILVVTAISLVSGWLVQRELLAQSTRLVVQEQEAILLNLVSQFSRELGDVQRIVDIVLSDSHIREFIASGETSEGEPENSLKELVLAWGNILQLRWLDDSGQEQLRMDYGAGLTEPRMVTDADLQNKAKRYYFRNGITAPQNELYISRIDLNIEHGAVVTPYQPTLRATVRTGDANGLRPGLFVVNYDLHRLLASLREQGTEKIQLLIVDEDGYFLLHPQSLYEWGRDLGSTEYSLAVQDEASWRQLQQRSVITGLKSEQGLLSAQKVSIDAGGNRQLYFITRTPAEVFSELEDKALLWGGLTALIIAAIGIAAALYDQRNLLLQYSLTTKLQEEKRALHQTNQKLDEHINNLKLMQDELVESRKLSALGMMVAGVAHELNTPVGGALIVTSGLEGELQSLNRNIDKGLTRQALQDYTESTGEALNLLNRNLKKAKNVIDSFKRLAVDRAGEERVTFRLSQVVEDIVFSLHPLTKDSGISIHQDIAVHSELLGYPGVLSQIIQNLVMNSINHAFSQQEDKSVDIIAEETGKQTIRLVFQDNGNGVTEAELAKLFDPFVTSARGRGSSGLGLHLVHQWVTGVMHGSVKAENRETGGLRFVILFPARIVG